MIRGSHSTRAALLATRPKLAAALTPSFANTTAVAATPQCLCKLLPRTSALGQKQQHHRINLARRHRLYSTASAVEKPASDGFTSPAPNPPAAPAVASEEGTKASGTDAETDTFSVVGETTPERVAATSEAIAGSADTAHRVPNVDDTQPNSPPPTSTSPEAPATSARTETSSVAAETTTAESNRNVDPDEAPARSTDTAPGSNTTQMTTTLWAPWQVSDLPKNERAAYKLHGPDYLHKMTSTQQSRALNLAARRSAIERKYREAFGEDWFGILQEATQRTFAEAREDHKSALHLETKTYRQRRKVLEIQRAAIDQELAAIDQAFAMEYGRFKQSRREKATKDKWKVAVQIFEERKHAAASSASSGKTGSGEAGNVEWPSLPRSRRGALAT